MNAADLVAVVSLLWLHQSSLMVLAEEAETSWFCPPVDGNSESCVCKTPNGIIDLRGLSNRNGTARFRNVNDGHYYFYDYNPCQAFHSNCFNVHICQASTSYPGAYYDIAEQGSEEMWIDSALGPYLYYTGPGSREARVYLHCDKSSRETVLTTTGDSKTRLSYVFDLYSCHACPGGCDGSFSGGAAGTIGLLLIFLVVLGFLVYLLFGVTYKRLYYGVSGVDLLPHIEFWRELPQLVHDGCWFTVAKCCPCFKHHTYKRKNKSSYEENEL